MPYKVIGTDVYVQKGGKWVLKGHSTKGKVKGYLKALYANSKDA
jgi:alpha-D-ribose 1-methylphosphonate 5-triphosphate synthase subunit PhnL